jgi:adenylate cyclase
MAELGGQEIIVSVLFADLVGFTTFSEQRPASEVIGMLNAYWSATVPVIGTREGGLIERFAGDAAMVVFNALGDQPDHSMRAVRAAFALQAETERIGAEHPQWPRFRVGVNTGPAVIGNVGVDEQEEVRRDRRHDQRCRAVPGSRRAGACAHRARDVGTGP